MGGGDKYPPTPRAYLPSLILTCLTDTPLHQKGTHRHLNLNTTLSRAHARTRARTKRILSTKLRYKTFIATKTNLYKTSLKFFHKAAISEMWGASENKIPHKTFP